MAVSGSNRVGRRKLRVDDLEEFARQIAGEEWLAEASEVSVLWPARYLPPLGSREAGASCLPGRSDSRLEGSSGGGADLPPDDAAYRTAELRAACRFLFECCWTYNEADGSVELIPDLEYIRWFAGEWLLNREAGGVLIVEKSRRLIMSWVCRSLELWAMGVRRSKFVICGLNYPKAAEHVWRVAWLWRELCRHRPELGLGKAMERGGNFGAQEMEQVILPNGSLIENLNQQGQSFQGSGYTGVVMEEFSQYAHPAYMYSQARRVTEGKPGQPGGFVVAITNAWPGSEWKELKRGP
jgi:hypothetical protein